MKLRDHPLMRHRSAPSWPPLWLRRVDERTKTARGEIGVLKYVHANPNLSQKCFLVVEHEREQYVGCLIVDDLVFLARVTEILKSQSGRPIKEIGDLDVSRTL